MDDLNAQLGRAPEPQGEKKKGCLFVGCMTLIVGMIVVPVCVYFAFQYGMNQIVGNYGSPQRPQLPLVEATESEMEQTSNRVGTFFENLRNGTQTEPLVLTARDLNLLVADDEELKQLKENVYFDLKDELISVKGSFSLAQMGFPDQFLNFEANLRPMVVKGQLSLILSTLSLKGVPIPLERMGNIQEKDLLADLSADPEYTQIMHSIERVEISGGKLRLFPKIAKPSQSVAVESVTHS